MGAWKGRSGVGAGVRNGPNNICTYEKMNKLKSKTLSPFLSMKNWKMLAVTNYKYYGTSLAAFPSKIIRDMIKRA
jgi:hypothetical protein